MKLLKVSKMITLSALTAFILLHPVAVFAEESDEVVESPVEEASAEPEAPAPEAPAPEAPAEESISQEEASAEPEVQLPVYTLDSTYSYADQLVIPEGGIIQVTEDAQIGSIYSEGDVIIQGIDGATLYVANTSYTSEYMTSHPGIVAKGSITIKDANIIDSSDGVAISDVSGSPGGITVQNSTIVVNSTDSTRIYGICSIDGISIDSSTITIGSNYSECGMFAFGNITNRDSEISIEEGGRYTIMSASLIDLGDNNYVIVPDSDEIVQVTENTSFAYAHDVSTVSSRGAVTIVSKTPEPALTPEPAPTPEPQSESEIPLTPAQAIIQNIMGQGVDIFRVGNQLIAYSLEDNPDIAVAYYQDGTATLIAHTNELVSTVSVDLAGNPTARLDYTISGTNELTLSSVQSNQPIVDIPASIELESSIYYITGIDENAFQNNEVIEAVNIGSNVTSIGPSAFEGCRNLRTIIIRDTLEEIGENAFFNIGEGARLQVIGTGDVRPVIERVIHRSNRISGIDLAIY